MKGVEISILELMIRSGTPCIENVKTSHESRLSTVIDCLQRLSLTAEQGYKIRVTQELDT